MNRERHSSETFRQYRRNQKEEGVWLDRRCNSGWMLWEPKHKGPYIRAKHGDLRRAGG